MNPNREEALFALALEKPAEKRPAFLDAVCEGDTALRARLEALLAAHEQPETPLATQAETARPTIQLDLADAPDEAVGQTLGRYKLLERVFVLLFAFLDRSYLSISDLCSLSSSGASL